MFVAPLLSILALLQLEGLTRVQSCSPLPGTESWSMVKTLNNAPAVVIATDVYHSINGSHETWYDYDLDNFANFEVHCVLKSGGYNIGSKIVIEDGAIRSSATCHTTFTNVGTKYIFGIKKSSSNSGRYYFYEPNPLTRGGYEPTQVNLNTAADVCGLDASSCPGAVDPNPSSCVDGDGITVGIVNRPSSTPAADVTATSRNNDTVTAINDVTATSRNNDTVTVINDVITCGLFDTDGCDPGRAVSLTVSPPLILLLSLCLVLCTPPLA